MNTRRWWAVKKVEHKGWYLFQSAFDYPDLFGNKHKYLGPYESRKDLVAFLELSDEGK